MATALRPHSRRVAEATPAAMTAAFLFEAAVCAATAGTGVGAVAGGASAAASIAGGDKGDAGNGVSAAASRKKKRPRLAPSTAALSHSLALAAGKLSRSSGAPLPRGASNALCSRCGKVLGAGGKDEIAVRPLSRSCRRRRRRAAATAAAATAAGATEPSSSSRRGRNVSAATSSSKELNTVVLVVKCGACGQAKRARGFYTRELGEAAASALRRGENGGGGGGGGGGG